MATGTIPSVREINCNINIFTVPKDLQNCVEIQLQMEAFSDDGNKDVSGNSDPDLGLYRVIGSSVEGLDPEMLLDPPEERLSGKGLARFLGKSPARFQPLPIGTAREVFPQAARHKNHSVKD